jgi:hypothetical protein
MQIFAKFDSIQCSSNRQQFYVAGICYSLTSFHLNFSSAVDYCNRHLGQLAAPASNNQRSALIDRLIDLYPMTSSLLGVSIIRQSMNDTSNYSSIDDESINCNVTTAACQWPRCAAANTRARRWNWTACNAIPLWICSYSQYPEWFEYNSICFQMYQNVYHHNLISSIRQLHNRYL